VKFSWEFGVKRNLTAQIAVQCCRRTYWGDDVKPSAQKCAHWVFAAEKANPFCITQCDRWLPAICKLCCYNNALGTMIYYNTINIQRWCDGSTALTILLTANRITLRTNPCGIFSCGEQKRHIWYEQVGEDPREDMTWTVAADHSMEKVSWGATLPSLKHLFQVEEECNKLLEHDKRILDMVF
jgi:hypothetical protein